LRRGRAGKTSGGGGDGDDGSVGEPGNGGERLPFALPWLLPFALLPWLAWSKDGRAWASGQHASRG
jgi:hypothetical protein